MKIIRFFLTENSQLLEVKFSIYLNRRVFVMEGSRYNLRNANDVKTINTRTALYFNSFLLSVIREWNTLSENDKYVDSIDSFKRQISRNKTAVPKYFYTGSRKLQILHTRLRTGCSSLNHVYKYIQNSKRF